MAVSGTVSSFNPHKGWGFIECNGQDVFVHKKDCGGLCLAKEMKVTFGLTTGEKGSQATDVKVEGTADETFYMGEIKTFNGSKGYGFIGCEAFAGQDVFVFRSEVPGGFAPQGGLCKFKVTTDDKGPAASQVQLLGSAGSQYQQMKQWQWMGGFGKGWGKGKGWGGKGKGKGGPRLEPEKKVWIGGIAPETTWKVLQEHLEKAGKTVWVEVFSGKGAGTGTAGFKTTEEVAEAIKTLNGSELNGAALTVDTWVKAIPEPKEEAKSD